MTATAEATAIRPFQIEVPDLAATVSLAGWVDTIRDQGGIIFVDLRDRRGVTQIKLEPHDNAKLADQLKHLKPESVIGITGKVVRRPAGTNPFVSFPHPV